MNDRDIKTAATVTGRLRESRVASWVVALAPLIPLPLFILFIRIFMDPSVPVTSYVLAGIMILSLLIGFFGGVWLAIARQRWRWLVPSGVAIGMLAAILGIAWALGNAFARMG